MNTTKWNWILLLSVLLFITNVQVLAQDQLRLLTEHPVAENIALADLDGKIHHISEYRGKTVIVNYFSTTCPACIEEIPSLNKMWKKMKKEGVIMLAINSRESAATVKKFIQSHPIDFPVWVDSKGLVYDHWPVKGIPTTLVLDKKGRFIYRALGKKDWTNKKILTSIYWIDYKNFK